MCFCFFFNEHKHTFEHHSKSFGNEWVEYGCRGESGPVPLYGTLLGQMPPCRSRLRGPMVTAQGRGGKTSLGDALGAGRCLMTTGVESAPGLNLRTGGGLDLGFFNSPPPKLEKNPPPLRADVKMRCYTKRPKFLPAGKIFPEFLPTALKCTLAHNQQKFLHCASEAFALVQKNSALCHFIFAQ